MTALQRAYLSLHGLSVGDAFGEQFFIDPEMAEEMIADRTLPSPPWNYTDDTEMALSVVANLRDNNGIMQERLAGSFALRYNPMRGYGPNMHGLLTRFQNGETWREAAASLFGGAGSYGNGAAMRAAPIGAFFAPDLDATVRHARLSAEVTHTHPDAIAGAIAVAVGAAWAWRIREDKPVPSERAFLDKILPHVPLGPIQERLRHARNLAPNSTIRLAVAALGNGLGLSAVDTVPLALWCAGCRLTNYEDALWLTVNALGDRDTTYAIVGGIVALCAEDQGIPPRWIKAREALPAWVL